MRSELAFAACVLAGCGERVATRPSVLAHASPPADAAEAEAVADPAADGGCRGDTATPLAAGATVELVGCENEELTGHHGDEATPRYYDDYLIERRGTVAVAVAALGQHVEWEEGQRWEWVKVLAAARGAPCILALYNTGSMAGAPGEHVLHGYASADLRETYLRAGSRLELTLGGGGDRAARVETCEGDCDDGATGSATTATFDLRCEAGKIIETARP